MDPQSEVTLLGTNLSKRIYGLDILRALAIIFVLLHHTPLTFSYHLNEIIKYIIPDGVSIFFVLSGYLIGNILIKTLNTNTFTPKVLASFWINRWLRTLPPYYFVLILLFVISKNAQLSVQSYFLSFWEKLSYFFFLQNFKSPHYGFFAESWSLSVEEWFYLLIPIILFVLINICRINIKKSVLYTILGVIFLVILYRLNCYYSLSSGGISNEVFDLQFRKLVITRLDCIMFGVLGAYVNYFYNNLWNKRILLSFFIGSLIIVFDHFINVCQREGFIFSGKWIQLYCCSFSFSIMSLGVLLLLPYLSGVKKGAGFFYKGITGISLISYSLYLLHFSLIYYCIIEPLYARIPVNKFLQVPIYWTLCIIFSLLMYKLIEIPGMNLRKRIFKKDKPYHNENITIR